MPVLAPPVFGTQTWRKKPPRKFECLYQPWRYKVLHGGRGGGKSHQIADALVTRAGTETYRILCCREIQRSIKSSVKQLLEDKINARGWGPASAGGSGMFRFTDTSIRCVHTGSEFLFAGLRTNPDSVKSMEGIDVAWVEEANTVSQRSLDLLIPTIRKEGSEIWFSFNRYRETDPVDRMFLSPEMQGRRDAAVVEVGPWDNPHFPDVLRAELEWDKRRDYDKYLHVWGGQPVLHSEARVFHNWELDDLDDQVGDATPRLGADWGFSTDPSVLVECFAFPERRLIYFRDEAYRVRCKIDDLPALFGGTDDVDPPRWENRIGTPGIASSRRFPIVADSSRPDTISYMEDRGFDIKGARKGPGSIEEGVEFMKSWDIVVHPDRCPHVRQELQLYSYKEDPHTGEVLPELADRHNHTIDSARYALEGVRRASVMASTSGAIAMPELVIGDY